MSAVNLVICLMRFQFKKKKVCLFTSQMWYRVAGTNTKDWPSGKGNSVEAQFLVVFFSKKNVTPLQEGEGVFLSTAMISYVGKLGMFPGMSQTAVSFSIRDFRLFQTPLVFSHFLQTFIPLRIAGRSSLCGFACARVSLAADRHGSVFTGNPGSHPSAY